MLYEVITYGIEGKSWIALGDPIGPRDEHQELLWRFRELCEQVEGWPVFYEVGHDTLYLYLDLGLTLLKIGEEARVDLQQFSLEGQARNRITSYNVCYTKLLRDPLELPRRF